MDDNNNKGIHWHIYGNKFICIPFSIHKSHRKKWTQPQTMVHCIFTVRKNNFSIIFIHFNFVETAKQRIFSVQTKTGALAMQMHIEKRRQKNPLMGKTLRITGSSNAQSHSIQFQKALFLFPSLFASKKNCIHLNFSAFTC